MSKEDTQGNSLLRILVDGAALAAAFLAAYSIERTGVHFMPHFSQGDLSAYVISLAVSFFIASLLLSPAKGQIFRPWSKELLDIVRFNLALTAVFAVILVLIKSPVLDSRYLFVYTILFNGVLMCLFRWVYRLLVRRTYRDEKSVSLIGLVSSPDRAMEILADVRSDWTRKLAMVALTEDGPGTEQVRAAAGADVQTGLTGLTEHIKRAALDEVLFALPYEALKDMEQEVEEIKSMGVVVHMYIPLVEHFTDTERTVDMIGGCPVVSIAAKTLDPGQLAIKRLCDIVLSCVGLILCIPIFLLVGIPLLIESPGPLVFSQYRVGRNGRVFRIYKLRSMYRDAEARKAELMDRNEMHGPMFKIENDPRITRVGRFIRMTSIDELPQLFNVLKGDMSLVGPRPPLLDEFQQYEARYKRRLSMRPGITGFWQVNGRNQVPDFEEVVRMDLAYIDNWSLGLDLQILFKTVAEVLSMSGR